MNTIASYTRLYTAPDGETHFEVVEVPLASSGMIGALSDPVRVDELLFRENEAGYDWDFHNAPARQFIIMLDGLVEVEASDGDRRVFSGGDVLLVEDTHGRGHRSRHVSPEPRRSIFVTLRD
jgi:hypothetical protein